MIFILYYILFSDIIYIICIIYTYIPTHTYIYVYIYIYLYLYLYVGVTLYCYMYDIEYQIAGQYVSVLSENSRQNSQSLAEQTRHETAMVCGHTDRLPYTLPKKSIHV